MGWGGGVGSATGRGVGPVRDRSFWAGTGIAVYVTMAAWCSIAVFLQTSTEMSMF